MNSKCIFVLVALCLVQGLHAKSVHDKRDIIDDIINQALERARQAIDDLENKAHDVLESGKVAIEQNVEKFIDSAKTALKSALAAVEGLGKRVAAQIEELIKKAEASGKDIAKCVDGKVVEAEKIEEDAVTVMTKCFDNSQQVQADIKATFETAVAEVEDSLKTVGNTVLSCLSPNNSTHLTLDEAKEAAKCVLVEIAHLPEEEQALFNKIASQVLASVQKTEAALKEEASCLATAQEAANEKEHALIKEIEKCIAELP